MATTTKKTTTKPKVTTVEETVEDIVESNVVAEEVYKPVVIKEKKVFTDSDYILCRSVCSGGLNVVSQSGNLYEFKDYGAECEINYRDLVTMIRTSSNHSY